MIVVSIIPGPHEPKLNISSFLNPLVEELQDSYNGVVLPSSSGFLKQRHVKACIVRIYQHHVKFVVFLATMLGLDE